MVDAGRDSPGAAQRSGTPDLAAGQALAAALGGATVARGRAPVGAAVLGTVRSAPVGTLIEQMLSESDNVIAEVLTRQVAIAAQQPASFAGGARAISASLSSIGITVGSGMKDGSGLSVLDRIPAVALGQVLIASSGSRHPELRPILAGLSVAGWDGTLVEQGRFTGGAASAVGLVRAKTGSLTGVSSIAGLVTDRDGRLLVFSMVADRVPSADPGPSRAALDAAVDALVGCGCR
jgi:D-alanyl-D-alanine carboxypeptidase/D-alanyl-D-alanine-endopeptidase (penicillin-binding protein 4)